MKKILSSIAAWLKQRPLQRTLIVMALGSAVGYAYYYYIGCASGTCLITSNPYRSSMYGAVMGLLIGLDRQKKKNKGSSDGTC